MKTIRNIVICIITMIMHITISFAQINLVTNPSFEELNACPSGIGQIDSVSEWHTPINGGGGNPDLYNVCCTNPSSCGVPSQTFFNTSQYPHFGNSYIGIETVISYFTDNWREYIQSKLLYGLQAGRTYCVKFYVSLSDQSFAYIASLGAYFDDGSVSSIPPHGLALVTPQVYNMVQPLSDTLNWMKIEGSFTATGDEEYITIGNFFPDSASGIGLIGSPTNWFAYYYIDDVSVIDAGLPAFAGNDTIIMPGDSVFIGRQPEVGLNEDCIWFVNGTPIDTVAGMWVKPDSTTTYILKQTICDFISYDTVTVFVSGVGIEFYENASKGITLFPNPNNGTFTIRLFGNSINFESAEVILTDIIGNQISVINMILQDNIAHFNAHLSNGVYFISVKDSKGNVYNPQKITVIK